MALTYRDKVAIGTDTTDRAMLLSDAKAYGRLCKRLGQYPECAEMANPVFAAEAMRGYESIEIVVEAAA